MAFEHEERPWGEFWTLFHPKMKGTFPDLPNRRFAIKVLNLEPNQQTSLQYHKGRNELLYVVAGSGIATLPDPKNPGDLMVVDVVQGICLLVPKGGRHRLKAKEEGMTIVEVWLSRAGPESEGFLDEADIVRLDDDYGRAQ